MRRILHASVILFGSIIGGILSQPALGWIHGAIAGALQLTQLTLQNTITWSGVSSPANSWIWQSNPASSNNPGFNPISGTCTDTFLCTPNLFVIGRDTVNASVGPLYGWYWVDNFGGAAAAGGHHTALYQFNYVAAPSDSNQAYTTLNSWLNVNVATNGGGFFAGNDKITVGTGATGVTQAIGREIDLEAASGSSVQDKIALQLVQTPNDVVSGSRENLGLSLNNSSGSNSGWDCGICFGAYAGVNPVDSTGTLVGTFNHAGSVGGGAMGTVANGVDFRQYTFTGTPFGAALSTPASSSATCVTGGIEWDASFVYICTATNTWKRATLATF